MTRERLINALIAILIGAGVAFAQALVDGLSALIHAHGAQILSGSISAIIYATKTGVHRA